LKEEEDENFGENIFGENERRMWWDLRLGFWF